MAPLVLNKRAESGIDFEQEVVRMEKVFRPVSGNSSVQHHAVKVVAAKGGEEVAYLIEIDDSHCAKEGLQGKAYTEDDTTRILLFQDAEGEWQTVKKRAGFSDGLTLGHVYDLGCQQTYGNSNELQNACWDAAARMWDATFSGHIRYMRDNCGIDFSQTVLELAVVSRPLDPRALAEILHILSSAKQASRQGFSVSFTTAPDKESQSPTFELVLAAATVVTAHKSLSINHRAALVRCKGEDKDKLYIIEKGIEISSDKDPGISVCYREMKAVKKGCRIHGVDDEEKRRETWRQDKRCTAVGGTTLEMLFDACCGFDGSECTARAAERLCQYNWYFDNCWNAVERMWDRANGQPSRRLTWQRKAVAGASAAAGTTCLGVVLITAVIKSQTEEEQKGSGETAA